MRVWTLDQDHRKVSSDREEVFLVCESLRPDPLRRRALIRRSHMSRSTLTSFSSIRRSTGFTSWRSSRNSLRSPPGLLRFEFLVREAGHVTEDRLLGSGDDQRILSGGDINLGPSPGSAVLLDGAETHDLIGAPVLAISEWTIRPCLISNVPSSLEFALI